MVDPQGQFHLGWVSKIGGPIVIYISMVAVTKSLVLITSPRVKVKVKAELKCGYEGFETADIKK